MSKQESKSWNNVPFKTWEYEEQTKMKHRVLSYYFPQWLQILGKWNKGLNYIDGFGGIGAYHTKKDIEANKYLSNNFGSPVVAALQIKKLIENSKIGKASIVIIDEDKGNIQNLKEVLGYNKVNTENIQFIEGNFDQEINRILDSFEKEVKSLAPTFFLIDPFGFSQVKMETIARILKQPKSEIIINFMYNAIQRWVSHPNPKLQIHYDNLFGCKEWKKYIGKRTDEKERYLVSLFRKQCKEYGKAKFVYPFRLSFPDKDMPYYYLFHLCNHQLGCIRFKDSFAKFNIGDLEYKGNGFKQESLFKPLEKNQKREIFIDNLLSKLKRKKISYGSLLNLIIDECDFLESGIKKILQELEKSGIIKIDGNGRTRKGGIDNSDIIIF
ncbi:MAG: three-Cys-motif partner protein TcmP [bacterium]|nr:three-Cys-motif partner protein TcmP [bacterium]